MKNILLIVLVVILGFWLPKKMKKAILIVFAAILSLCLVGAAGLGLFLASLPDDIPTFDDSHLIRPTESVPTERNAFTFYAKAIDALVYPEDHKTFNKILDGEAWDDEFVQGVMDQNSATFAFVTEGNRQERCIAPRVTSINTLMPYIAKWRAIARLFVVKIAAHTRRGEPAEALTDVTTLMAFSHRVVADAGCLIHYLVGVSIHEMCMRSTRELVWSGLLSDNQLTQLQSILLSNSLSSDGYVSAWQGEYEVFSDLVDTLHTGDHILDDIATSGLASWIQRGAAKYFLHANRTKREMGLIYSGLIDQATNCYGKTEIVDVDQFVMDKKGAIDKANGVAKFRVPNPLGTILYTMMLPAYQAVVNKKCRAEVSYRATVVLVALQRFKNTNNSLPPSLDALVLEFLPAVPVDSYDGKPMRYSPTLGIVYSVGEDLEDSGGSTELLPGKEARRPRQWQWLTKDLVFGIEERIELQSAVPSPSVATPLEATAL